MRRTLAIAKRIAVNVGRAGLAISAGAAVLILHDLYPLLALLLLASALCAALSMWIEANADMFVCDCDECAHVLPSQRDRWHRNVAGVYVTSRELTEGR